MQSTVWNRYLLILAGLLLLSGLFAYRKPAGNTGTRRMIFKTQAGPVLFNHALHADEHNGIAACFDCHHNYDGKSTPIEAMRCFSCHGSNPDLQGLCADPHPRCVGTSCQMCHQGESCDFCHRK